MKNANKEACHCKNVTYAQIRSAVRQGAKTLEEVQAITGCGTWRKKVGLKPGFWDKSPENPLPIEREWAIMSLPFWAIPKKWKEREHGKTI